MVFLQVALIQTMIKDIAIIDIINDQDRLSYDGVD